jgi:hypothetical protein
MKAAVVHDFSQPLSIDDVPRPEPGDGQVLVRIEACGLCHTDIHAAHGDWPIKPPLPLIPGHEGVGIVEALGPGAGEEIVVGDRVAIPWLGFACGHCRYCNSGRETLCEAQPNTGYSVDGGYGEYATAYARHVVKVPEGEDSLDAAPLSCAGVTVYKAVKSSEVGPSQLCPIFGVGGLKGSIVGAHPDVEDVSSCRRSVAPGCSTRPALSRRSTRRSTTSSTRATTRRVPSYGLTNGQRPKPPPAIHSCRNDMASSPAAVEGQARSRPRAPGPRGLEVGLSTLSEDVWGERRSVESSARGARRFATCAAQGGRPVA